MKLFSLLSTWWKQMWCEHEWQEFYQLQYFLDGTVENRCGEDCMKCGKFKSKKL